MNAQLTLPTLDGIEFPEARLQFTGGMEIDAATIEEVLGTGNPKLGDEIAVTVTCTVTKKVYKRGTRDQDGLAIAQPVHSISLKVDSIEPG